VHDPYAFVQWFRNAAPYINAFRGRTFVLAFGGECVADEEFAHLIHDIALLNSLGVKLILVHGARPQIEQTLSQHHITPQIHNGIRITDSSTLPYVKQSVGAVRMEIEALLTMGIANSPMAGAQLRVASGNFITAKPTGVREGIDHCHTGEVRRVDHEAIQQLLDQGWIVLLSPIGYSPTGEVFNLLAEDVAVSTCRALKADKLIYLTESSELVDEQGKLIKELKPTEAQQLIRYNDSLTDETKRYLYDAATLCQNGLHRAHLIPRHVDGALIQELFTRDGIGTLISNDSFEGTRQAKIEDVGGIIELLEPLEQQGILVRRSREHLEQEISQFTVVERDGTIIGCAALYPYPEHHIAELACVAVHPDYRNSGRGDTLVDYITQQAKQRGLKTLFVLTTHTAHWFIERGFAETDIGQLPLEKQELYNYQRKSKIFSRPLN